MAKRNPRTEFRPKLVSAAVAACFSAGTALANPTGPAVVNGTASIVQNGNLLQITNSPNAIINWQSFSIGANEITRFLQQSASSAVLNRVVTQDPSSILGALQSNGRVFLINPNGITFGTGSQVDVAGLVASSLNLSNEDFLAGRMRFTEVPGAGSVLNQGNINTGSGGSVYLVGPAVTNSGIITSPQGEVILAAGNSVELVNPGTPNLRVEIAATDNQAVNLGQVIADAGRIGIYAGLINNSGTIRADSAVSEGGRILLKATKSATLENTSVLSAQGQGGGEIKVLAGDSVQVAGRLDASAPNGGDGGFIETSGKNVQVESGTIITTAAPQGKTGTWLIDPTDFTIAAGTAAQTASGIGATTLSTSLGTTSVVIATLATGTEPGDIFVNDAVSWSSGNDLTLTAFRNVNVDGAITSTGGGTVALYAGWDGTSPAATPIVTSGIGTITVNAPITVSNTFGSASVTLTAGAGINVNNTSISATAGGSGNAATVGLTAGTAISVTNNSTISATGGSGEFGGDATVTLNAGTTITVDGSVIRANAGFGRCAAASCPPGAGGDATVTLIAPGGITVRNFSAVEARGGAGFDPSFGGGSAQGGNALVEISGGGITVSNNSLVLAWGGSGGSSANGGNAEVKLTAGSLGISILNSLGVESSAGVIARGGFGSNSGGSATVTLDTTGGITVDNSLIRATGGNFSFGTAGNASVQLKASGGIALGSTLEAIGGAGISGSGNRGQATVVIASTGGNIVSSATINADGPEGSVPGFSGSIVLDAPNGFIKNGTQGPGVLTVTNSNNFGTIKLTARDGIGDVSSPIRIDRGDDPDLFFQNTGTGGDIAVSFFNNPATPCGARSGSAVVCIDGNLFGTFNNNPAGTFYVKAEDGGIQLEIPFAPNGAGLLSQQSVMFEAPAGDIVIGPSGSILANTSPTGGVVRLTASGLLDLQSGSQVSGRDVSLTANDMNILGTVTGGPYTTLLPFTASRGIDLGSLCTVGCNNLSLDNAELNNIFGGAIIIGDQFGGSGALTFVGDVGPTSSFLNVRGTSVTQTAGSISGGINAYAGAGAVNLGSTTNQIDYITGGTNGGAFTVNTGTSARLFDVNSNNGNINIQTSNGNLTFGSSGQGGPLDAGAGSVVLTAAKGSLLDENGGMDIVAGSAALTGTAGIGTVANPLETQAPTITLTTTSGEVGISNAGALTVNGSITGSAALLAANGGALTLAANMSTTGGTTLSGSSVTQSGGEISGLVNANASAGNVNLSQAGGYSLGLLSAAGSVFVNSSGGAITDGNSGLNVQAPSAQLTASSGIGSIANPLETLVGQIYLDGGTGEIGIFNTGNLTLTGLSNSGSAAVGATGSMLVSNFANVGGNVSLIANGLNVTGGVFASGDVVLNGQAGNLDVTADGGEGFVSGNNVFLLGANVNILGGSLSFAQSAVNASGFLSVLTPGNFVVQGGSGSFASASATGSAGTSVVAGGNVMVTGGSGSGAYALIMGSPDVTMNVGGTIQLNGTSGSFARIEAGTPRTINLTFPLISSGGYFVNGVEGAIVDNVDNPVSGFFVEGLPAILDENLFVTYGGAPVFNDILVSSMNQNLESLTGQMTGGEVGEGTPEDDEKKKLPVCGG